MPVVRDLCLRWRSTAGRNQKENPRPTLVHLPGKLDPIELPRHLYIGEEHAYVGMVRHRHEGCFCTGHVYDFVARLSQ
jgi:hypothetical protein